MPAENGTPRSEGRNEALDGTKRGATGFDPAENSSTIPTTVEEFIAALIPEIPEGQAVCYSRKRENGWNQQRIPFTDFASDYYCVSTVKRGKGRKVRRRKQDLEGAYVLVLDDVGTKGDEPPVRPTYVMETSEGNFQFGYRIFLTRDLEFFEACARGCALAGFADSGTCDAGRVMRTPGSINDKEGKDNFKSRLVEWHPERIWELSELMVEFGIEPDTVKRIDRSGGNGASVPDGAVKDVVLDWLREQKLVTDGPTADGWCHLECPWADEHVGDPRTGAKYSPLGRGSLPQVRGFKCFHSHGGREHNSRDFMAWVEGQGGPSAGAYDAEEVVAQVTSGPAPKGEEGRANKDCTAFAMQLRMTLPKDRTFEAADIDFGAVERFVGGTMFEPKSGKFMMFDSHGFISQHTEKAFVRYILKGAYQLVKTDNDEARTWVRDKVLGFLMTKRQINSVRIEVDMFAPDAHWHRTDDGEAVLVRPFVPLEAEGHDAFVVEDFRDHFPLFHAFLDFIAACRFASDRREGYLWLRGQSGWGKSFLMALLEAHGIVISTSETEIEKALSGSPSGIDVSRVRDPWVLFIDEFRKVKAELKTLNREMTFSPKHKLRLTLPLYAKIFCSAETSRAMTEEGVEEQFAQRFNVFEDLVDQLDDREMFLEVGRAHYFANLKAYVGERLNALVKEYKAKGPEGAAGAADAALMAFHEEHGIAKLYGSLDDTIKQVADEMRAGPTPLGRFAADDDGNFYVVVTNMARRVEDYIQDNFSVSTRAKVSYKIGAIVALLQDHEPYADGTHYFHTLERVKDEFFTGKKVRMRGCACKISAEVAERRLMSTSFTPH